jgi:hypothetical protein
LEVVIRRIIARFLDKQLYPEYDYFRFYFLCVLRKDGAIRFGGKPADPPMSALKRLWRRHLPVRNYSDSTINNNMLASGVPDTYHDKKTGQSGFLIVIDNLEWTGRNKVHVYAGYTSGYTYHGAGEYLLTLRRGKWRLAVLKEDASQEFE